MITCIPVSSSKKWIIGITISWSHELNEIMQVEQWIKVHENSEQ